ncbi:hypothetical protein FRB99_008959, partial [Tulasnella sp. 403]
MPFSSSSSSDVYTGPAFVHFIPSDSFNSPNMPKPVSKKPSPDAIQAITEFMTSRKEISIHDLLSAPQSVFNHTYHALDPVLEESETSTVVSRHSIALRRFSTDSLSSTSPQHQLATKSSEASLSSFSSNGSAATSFHLSLARLADAHDIISSGSEISLSPSAGWPSIELQMQTSPKPQHMVLINPTATADDRSYVGDIHETGRPARNPLRQIRRVPRIDSNTVNRDDTFELALPLADSPIPDEFEPEYEYDEHIVPSSPSPQSTLSVDTPATQVSDEEDLKKPTLSVGVPDPLPEPKPRRS